MNRKYKFKFKKIKFNENTARLLGVCMLAAFLTFKFGQWMWPVSVSGSSISRMSLRNRLEERYGKQMMEDMINEKILDQALKESRVKVAKKKIEERMAALEKQFENQGGLENYFKQKGITKKDLTKQIKNQLMIEEVLKDKTVVYEDEISEYYQANQKTIYKGKELLEVKEEIRIKLHQVKLNNEFAKWMSERKLEAIRGVRRSGY